MINNYLWLGITLHTSIPAMNFQDALRLSLKGYNIS